MRYADLSAHAGKTVQDVQIVNDACSPAGSFWATFTDIAIASTDGAVRPIYNRQKSMTLSVSCDSGVTDCWQIIGHPTGIGWAYHTTTTYYHGDHLGSSRFLSSYNGTPMWEATYLPYGQEWNGPSGGGPVSPNHYKFTGKERDGESGLDYFGARYYASALGRFTSPDRPFLDQHRHAPQTWNLYSYGRNNPLRFLDLLGNAAAEFFKLASFVVLEYELLDSRSPFDALTALAGRKSARGAGIGVPRKGGTVYLKDPGFKGEEMAPAIPTVGFWGLKRRNHLAYFAELRNVTVAFTDYNGVCHNYTRIQVNIFQTTDSNPPATMYGAPSTIMSGTDPSHIAAISGNTADLRKLSDNQLAAVMKKASEMGLAELQYELNVEEGRRKMQQRDEEEKKKKGAK